MYRTALDLNRTWYLSRDNSYPDSRFSSICLKNLLSIKPASTKRNENFRIILKRSLSNFNRVTVTRYDEYRGRYVPVVYGFDDLYLRLLNLLITTAACFLAARVYMRSFLFAKYLDRRRPNTWIKIEQPQTERTAVILLAFFNISRNSR